MAKLQQSRITLKNYEIDIAHKALQLVSNDYKCKGDFELAEIYDDMNQRIYASQMMGDTGKAEILLIGGQIPCMKYALEFLEKLDVDSIDMTSLIRAKVTANTRGLESKYN